MGTELYYKPGSFYRICDRTGFATRAERTAQEWNGLMVRDSVFEARQPQDFVKGVQDNQTVPLARPRQVNSFLGPLTTNLTANVAAGANTLPITSSVRMQIGDSMEVILNTGQQFLCTISNVPTPTSIQVNPVLAYSASAGNLVTDLSAVTTASIG